jgi:phosphoribosylformylglycinamidine cyclo-ligase
VYWKETGDLSVFKGIAQDAVVMNLDDLLCVGVTNEPIIYSSTIGRNKKLIPGEVINAIVEGTQEFFTKMGDYGINIIYSGGETADVGDLVRTLIVDGTVAVRVKRSKVIVPNVSSGDFIIGFSSTGRANYEENENSGMGSNGLTSSRHDMFNKKVGEKYPESFDNKIEEELTYCGKYNLTSMSPIKGISMGKFVLSPTMSYAPLIMAIIEMIPKKHIHAIIHCSGGGQTKILRFINDNVEIIKDNLFLTPELFKLIQKSAQTDWREMYKNFNMGHRMEICCSSEVAGPIMAIARGFNIEAKKVGYCVEREKGNINPLRIESSYGTFYYH